MTQEQIREIVKIDLENAIFSVGDPKNPNNIFRQILGVPMGSPLSPALAKIVCIYFENKFLKTIENDKS